MRLHRSPQQGLGILLVIILSFIVVLSIIGIGQRYLTSAVTNQTFRSSIGDLALELAESAAEEALQQLRIGVNDPSSPLFSLLRKDVYADQSGELALTPFIKPVQTNRILQENRFSQDNRFSKFYIKHLTADVVYQRQFEDLPYERFGLIKIKSRVQFDVTLTECVIREIEMAVGFKMVLVAPPRPYDQATFLVYVSDASISLNHSEINTKKKELLGRIKELLDLLDRLSGAPSTPEVVRTEYQQLKNTITLAETWQEKLPDFPVESVVAFAAKGNGQSLTPEDLFVWKRIDEKERSDLVPARNAVDRAVRVLAAQSDNLGSHREMLSALRQENLSIGNLLKIMLDYKDTFRFWVGTDFECLDHFRYKLVPGHWGNKPFFVVSDGQPEPVDSQFRRLVSSMKTINGVVRVDNGNQTLHLDSLTIRGKLVVVTTGQGGVKVSNLNVGERAGDLLTVLCLNGTLSIENDVHAALITTEGNLSIKPGSTIHGLLISGKVPSTADRQCTITRLDKYYSGLTRKDDASGAFRDYYYVGISPRIVYKKVSRR